MALSRARRAKMELGEDPSGDQDDALQVDVELEDLDTVETAPPKNPDTAAPKPKLRGVSHLIALVVSIPLGLWMVFSSPEDQRLYLWIYAFSISFLFFTSALLHIPHWGDIKVRTFMQKLDHSAIFVLIAGTYTPIIAIGFPERMAIVLTIVWGFGIIGVLINLCWMHAPKIVRIIPYLVCGWGGVLLLNPVKGITLLGWTGCSLMLLGGIMYSIGAVIYAKHWPNPIPHVFGFHEIFHLLVIAAGLCFFLTIVLVIIPYGESVSAAA